MFVEYFPAEGPSPALDNASAGEGLTAVTLRGPASFINIGDWVSHCLVTAKVSAGKFVYLALNSPSINGKVVGYANFDKDAIVKWESVIPYELASEYLNE